jgi:hypothetical protein
VKKGNNKQVVIAIVCGAVLLAAGLGLLLALTPNVRFQTAIPGRPLLQNDEENFTDRQVGIQFTPPGNWSMQARATETGTDKSLERMVVKYKRLIPGLEVAWIKVSVEESSTNIPLVELLNKRKPPLPSWSVIKPVENDLTVGGQPAARITYGGIYDPDQKGDRHFTCEVVAIRPNRQVFYFAGTYVTEDAKGQKRIRTALDSVTFDRQQFTSQK